MDMKYYEGKWIVGVSGGVDSMALLHMARCSKMKVIVAHVNYHKRESALRDEQCVQHYCETYQIPFYKKDAMNYNASNFQDQARIIRYEFFKELALVHNANGVLVAHHQDDQLETYLLQKQRNIVPLTYGLSETSEYQALTVVRPLLGYSKEDLVEYCKTHNVLYCEDESNQSDAYERNKLRHHHLQLNDAQQKAALMQELTLQSRQLIKLRKQSDSHKEMFHRPLDLNAFINIKKDVLYLTLSDWIYEKCEHRCSLKFIKELCRKLLGGKPYWFEKLYDNYIVEYEYQKLNIRQQNLHGFSYEVKDDETFQTPFFSYAKEGKKIEGFCASSNEFPLRIRNWKQGDTISLVYGSKKVSRFFIDRKIPHANREIWPVVTNNVGEIIFVCGIGCDNKHYSNTLSFFVVK